MSDGIYAAAAGAVARQNQIDVLANNLANVSTAGFRAARTSFAEVLTAATSASQHFVATGSDRLATEPGPLKQTGSPLDLAINGPAFFVAAERDGKQVLLKTVSLQINPDGLLLDSAGRAMVQGNDVLRVNPRQPLTVTAEGELVQAGSPVGRLSVVTVADAGALSRGDSGALIPNPQSGPVFEAGYEVISGSIEGSNVNPLRGMVELIGLHRDYQALLRSVSSYKEADEQLIKNVGESR